MTPTFHSESTLARAEYRNTPRPCFRSIHAQKPAKNPPRKKRCVGSTDRGSQFWKKQMLAHAVLMEPVTKADILRARSTRRWRVETGLW